MPGGVRGNGGNPVTYSIPHEKDWDFPGADTAVFLLFLLDMKATNV